jgi:hypothetical protein
MAPAMAPGHTEEHGMDTAHGTRPQLGILSLAAAVVVAVAACTGGPTEPGGAATQPPVANSGTGSCSVQATGDLEFSIDRPPGTGAAFSDYWLSDEQLAESGEEFDIDVDARLAAGEQIVWLLSIACGFDDRQVHFFSSDSTTRADLPHGAGSHPVIVDVFDEGPGIRGSLIAPDDSLFGIQPGGMLEIVAWDNSHIAGTFEFEAEESLMFVKEGESPRRLHVEGSFDLRCPGFADKCN